MIPGLLCNAETPDVFLGGECGQTVWRKQIVIPRLEAASVTYYNPQYPPGVWSSIPNIIEIEDNAKKNAKQMLIVIRGGTRGIMSMLEALEWVLSGTFVHLVIDDMAYGSIVDGREMTGQELKELNNGREYLRHVVKSKRPNQIIHKTVEDATEAIIDVAAMYRKFV